MVCDRCGKAVNDGTCAHHGYAGSPPASVGIVGASPRVWARIENEWDEHVYLVSETDTGETVVESAAHVLGRLLVRHRWDTDWLYNTLHRIVTQRQIPDDVLSEIFADVLGGDDG